MNRRLPWLRTLKGVLDREDCALVLKHVEMCGGYSRDEVPDCRRTDVFDIPLGTLPWLTAKFENVFQSQNMWKLQTSGLYSVLRVQRYRRGDYIERHIDYDYLIGDHTKLTAVVQLIDREAWSGGTLYVGNDMETPTLEMGDAVIFPSFAIHQVSKIRSGQRLTLAAWAMGDPMV